MSADEPIFNEVWTARGSSTADAMGRTLERVRLRIIEHLPDLIASRPGTRLVMECVSRAVSPGLPSFAITMEIARLRDGEPDA